MDDVITLVSEFVSGHDEYGNELITTTEKEVFCRTYGIDRNEFYSAATAGLKPEITVRLSDHADYEGEKTAIFHGNEYDIIRTYIGDGRYRTIDLNEIELTLQRKISNG